MRLRTLVLNAVLLSLLVPGICPAQVTAADYDRAARLREKFQGLAVNIPEPANAIENTSRFWYRKSVKGYPYYDISRVGIYGTSAGGQNATGGVLFHPEFYKVAVSNSGSHDNRMDKIWWNEHWMGWPLGPHYAASSNVDNAYRLQGKLLLVVPELDTNVDPSSTYQVVNALIKANKKFDLLVVPGGGHGAGGAYYQRLLQDFFVHHLLGMEPPDWNSLAR